MVNNNQESLIPRKNSPQHQRTANAFLILPERSMQLSTWEATRDRASEIQYQESCSPVAVNILIAINFNIVDLISHLI